MNTPNKITLSRILLIPLVIFFYLATFIPYGKLIAGLIFAIACLTDFLDGKIARKTNQVTDLGKFFDAIADKVLIMTGMILVVAFPVASGTAIVNPLWLGIVCIVLMLAREFIISALRQIAASKGTVLAADKGGKVKALFQDVTINLYIFYAFFIEEFYPVVDTPRGFEVANKVVGIVLMVLLVVSTVLTITSGISYLVRNKQVFTEKKEDNLPQLNAVEEKPVESVEVVKPVAEVEEMPAPIAKSTAKRTASKTTRKTSTNTKPKPTKSTSNKKKSSKAKTASKTKSTKDK